MPAPKVLTREYRIYLAIWRKAYLQRNDPDPTVSWQASSFSMALQMRQGMYRAIRPYRIGKDLDEELRLAAELFVVAVVRGKDIYSPHTITVKPRAALSELEKDMAALGIDEEDLLLTEEKVLRSNFEDFLKPSVDETAIPLPRPSNPFYTRED